MGLFFSQQMDYVFFIYGLAFILLATTVLGLCRLSSAMPQALPWKWLGAFALLHGINEWLDMLALAISDNFFFMLIRLLCMATSFLFLVEFGRAGTLAMNGSLSWRWMYLPLLGTALSGALAGMAGLNATCRYSLGFTGGLWAARALAMYSKGQEEAAVRRLILAAAWCLAFYGLAAGVVVPQADFFPASLVNSDSFFELCNFPVQLLRALLACLVAAAIWQHYCWLRDCSMPGAERSRSSTYGWVLAVCLLAILTIGWLATNFYGLAERRGEQRRQQAELSLAENVFVQQVDTADSLVKNIVEESSPLASSLDDPDRVEALNAILDRCSRVLSDSVCYVIGPEGRTIASSNRHTPVSFVGESYRIRPYFKGAMAGNHSRYVAVGLTSKIPGYYTSAPLRGQDGRIFGVAAIKINIDTLPLPKKTAHSHFLVDGHGVILSSTLPGQFLTPLWPLAESVRHELVQSRRYPHIASQSLIAEYPVDDSCLLAGKPMLIKQQPTAVEGLRFVVTAPMSGINKARMFALFATLLGTILLITFFVVEQYHREAQEFLRYSERRLNDIIDFLPDALLAIDREKKIVVWNKAIETMTGIKAEEMIGKGNYEYTIPFYGERRPQLMDLVWEKEQTVREGYRNVHREGEFLSAEAFCGALYGGQGAHVFAKVSPLHDQAGKVVGAIELIRDITEAKRAEEMLRKSHAELEVRVEERTAALTAANTALTAEIEERKRVEEALRKSESLFRSIYDNIGNGVAVIGKDMEISAMNKQMQKWFPHIDLNKPHLCYRSFNVPPREDVCDYCPTIDTLKDGQVHTAVTETPTLDGIKYYKVISTPLLAANGAIESAIELVEDITERKQAEEKLKQNLKEKETLLREIHHRVKNNLAVVTSLLSLQAARIQDDNLKAMFDESRQRVFSMALVHEKLYRTADLGSIDFNEYLNQIAQELVSAYNMRGREVVTKVKAQGIMLDIETAIPCGLISNELITNALKYAFSERQRGELDISFDKSANTYRLTIKDNGIGLPKGFDHTKGKTLGLQLVEALVRQLRGTLQFQCDAATGQGTEVIVTFKENELPLKTEPLRSSVIFSRKSGG